MVESTAIGFETLGRIVEGPLYPGLSAGGLHLRLVVPPCIPHWYPALVSRTGKSLPVHLAVMYPCSFGPAISIASCLAYNCAGRGPLHGWWRFLVSGIGVTLCPVPVTRVGVFRRYAADSAINWVVKVGGSGRRVSKLRCHRRFCGKFEKEG